MRLKSKRAEQNRLGLRPEPQALDKAPSGRAPQPATQVPSCHGPPSHTSSRAVLASSCTLPGGRWGSAVGTATVEMGMEPQDQAWQPPGVTEARRPNRKRRGQADDRDSPAGCCCGYPPPPSFGTRTSQRAENTPHRQPHGDRSARERPAGCLYRLAAFPDSPRETRSSLGRWHSGFWEARPTGSQRMT